MRNYHYYLLMYSDGNLHLSFYNSYNVLAIVLSAFFRVTWKFQHQNSSIELNKGFCSLIATLQRGKISFNECLGYDGEAPVILEL